MPISRDRAYARALLPHDLSQAVTVAARRALNPRRSNQAADELPPQAPALSVQGNRPATLARF